MSKVVVLENDKFIIKLLSLGATLSSFYVKPVDTDIIIGFDETEKYLEKGNASMGKSVGRCANRIGNARFRLDGVDYELLANNGPNCLHGGAVRFGDVEWDLKEKSDTDAIFTYLSKDMESGFPGNLKVAARYELCDDGLKVIYEGISDKNTLFNVTNHAYFNLDKDKTDILMHELKVPSGSINLNDENGMAMEETILVDNTPFDFREFKNISDAISANGVVLNQYCKGIYDGIVKLDGSEKRLIDNIDVNYIYENFDDKVLCELKNEKVKLTISSDLPGLQVYAGKYLDVDGRDGHYGAYAGIAMEPQFCPNAINYDKFLKPILKANEKVSHYIRYKVAV